MANGPWIDEMAETLQTLGDAGASLLLGTTTWSFAAEMLSGCHGFTAVSGTEMTASDGVLSGVVSRCFNEHDKLRFVKEWCAEHGYALSQVAAVGDSRSDALLFREVGLSVALNATPDARSAATQVLDSDDLRDVLSLLKTASKPVWQHICPGRREARGWAVPYAAHRLIQPPERRPPAPTAPR